MDLGACAPARKNKKAKLRRNSQRPQKQFLRQSLCIIITAKVSLIICTPDGKIHRPDDYTATEIRANYSLLLKEILS